MSKKVLKENYVELNCMTSYSLNDSTLSLSDIINKMPNGGRVAITDFNHTGAFCVTDKLIKEDIKPIYGLSLFIKSLKPRNGHNVLSGAPFIDKTDIQGEYIVLLAKDKQGLENLYRLASHAKNHGENYSIKTDTGNLEMGEHVSLEDIKPYSEGLLCLTGTNYSLLNKEIHYSETSKKVAEKNSEKVLNSLIDVFGKENVIIQLFQTSYDLEGFYQSKSSADESFTREDARQFYDLYIQKEEGVINNLKRLINKFNIDYVWTRGSVYSDDSSALNSFVYQRFFADNQSFNLDPETFHHSFYDDAMFDKAVENTVKVANRCMADITFGEYEDIYYFLERKYSSTREYALTESQMKLDRYAKENNLSEEKIKEYQDRLDFEIGVVDAMVAQRGTDFFAYFYFVADYINFCKCPNIRENWDKFFPHKTYEEIHAEGELHREKDSEGNFITPNPYLNVIDKEDVIFVGPGRGSAGGSLMCFLLDITSIDPMIYGGIMGRFLNVERISMPDIDTDFEMLRRMDVLRYFQAKYGYEHAGRFYTIGKYKPKSAMDKCLRLVGADKQLFNMVVSKEIDADIGTGDYKKLTLKDVLDSSSLVYSQTITEFYNKGNEDFEYEIKVNGKPKVFVISNFKKAFDYAVKLCGLHSNESVHASAFLVTPKPLVHYGTVKEEYIDGVKTQVLMVEGEPGESMGLLKYDVLGLQTLDIMHKASDLIYDRYNVRYYLEDMPLDDIKSFELIAKGDTIGIFQFEASGMTKTIKSFMEGEIEKGTAVERLFQLCSITTSAFRPGPMEFIPDMLAVKHGTKTIDERFPDFVKDIVKTSFGIMIYQEQIMQVYQAMGATEGEADGLRKAAGKKKVEIMAKIEPDFRAKAEKVGMNEEITTYIWNSILKFAGYGFNKAHADEYTMLTVQTAWLKANYRAEFLQAALNMAVMYDEESGKSQNKRDVFAKLIGHTSQTYTIMPPQLDYSEAEVIVSDKHNNCTLGLGSIGSCGSIANKIIRARNKHGKFINFADLLVKCNLEGLKLSKTQLENLVKAGACDSLIKDYYEVDFNPHRIREVIENRNVVLENMHIFVQLGKYIEEKVKVNDSSDNYKFFVENYKELLLLDEIRPDSKSKKNTFDSPKSLIDYEMKNFGTYITFDLLKLLPQLGEEYDGTAPLSQDGEPIAKRAYGIFTEQISKNNGKYKMIVRSNHGVFELKQNEFDKDNDLNIIYSMEIKQYEGHVYSNKQNEKQFQIPVYFYFPETKEEANRLLTKYKKVEKKRNISEINVICFKGSEKKVFN